MKIKTKKQLNLPQLIEWAMGNNVDNSIFVGKKNLYNVGFNKNSLMYFNTTKPIPTGEIFTVTTEEEITEDTEIPKLMTTFKKICLEGGIGYQRVRIDENYPIKLMLNKAEEHREPVETLHVVNDDGTHTLIWRDGKLVE
ncbi:hypothetical protein [Staphylococcus xylosus]|uniref:hypothetical protein n=1 Tax=Staphylococcus xylosus TaxID=1288 RepID=UPI003F56F2D3